MTSNTKLVILFTNARNESNIKEWITHHLLIGFNLIYIFDHKSKEPIKSQLGNFDNRVMVERCELDIPPKIPLMNKAANIAKILKADWFIYLDADEFLILNNFVGVKKMLDNFQLADSVAVNWLMFGTNNHIQTPDGLILDNYTKSDETLNQHVKTFVRPSQVIDASNPHCYNIKNPNKMYAVSGRKLVPPFCFNKLDTSIHSSNAFIAHYINQSEETYKKRKISIPQDDIGVFRTMDTDIHKKHNLMHNFIPSKKYSENIKKFLEYKQSCYISTA